MSETRGDSSPLHEHDKDTPLVLDELRHQLDRDAEWQTCDAVDRAARVLLFSENLLEQIRSSISDFWLIANIPRSDN